MDSCPYLVRLCQPISSASIGGIRKLVVKIPRMDTILMGYWMAGQVRTTIISVMYKRKFRMGNMILRMFLMMPYDMLLRHHLRNTSSISLLVSGKGRVGRRGAAL